MSVQDAKPAAPPGSSSLLSSANQARINKLQHKVQSVSSLKDVAESLPTDATQQSLDTILSTYSNLSLLSEEEQQLSQDDSEFVPTFLKYLAANLQNKDTKSEDLAAEATIACFYIFSQTWQITIPADILVQVAAFTNPQDPWVTKETSTLALSILPYSTNPREEDDVNNEGGNDGDATSTFIVQSILQDYLRPIFSKSTTKVTSSGRPNQFPDPNPNAHRRHIGVETPAWKAQGPKLLAIFQWAVNTASEPLIRNNWHLFTPVLLTLIEDTDTPTRQSGLLILSTFLSKCPAKILQSTGIGTVFQDAIFPSLLFLPSITPEAEAVELTNAAYKALLALVERESDPGNTYRRTLLDKMLRDGIFTAYHHASEYIDIVEALMANLTVILDCLEIYSVKHLQNLLPMFSSTMTDPFVISRPTALLETTTALTACLRNGWPRIAAEPRYLSEVIRIISVCWLNLYDNGELLAARPSPRELEQLTGALRQVSDVLHALSEEGAGGGGEGGSASSSQVRADLIPILHQEPKLAKLFSWVEES